MERALTMVLHAVFIGLIFYLFMVYVINQNPLVAEKLSVLIGAFVLVYMVIFGHGLPRF